jgi:hypothetical protein
MNCEADRPRAGEGANREGDGRTRPPRRSVPGRAGGRCRSVTLDPCPIHARPRPNGGAGPGAERSERPATHTRAPAARRAAPTGPKRPDGRNARPKGPAAVPGAKEGPKRGRRCRSVQPIGADDLGADWTRRTLAEGAAPRAGRPTKGPRPAAGLQCG